MQRCHPNSAMSPTSSSQTASEMPSSLAQFSRMVESGLWVATRPIYTIRRRLCLPLDLSPRAMKLACRLLRVPAEEVCNQELIEIVNEPLQTHSTFGMLRSRRVPAAVGLDPADLIDLEKARNGCEWCDGSVRGLIADQFGAIVSEDGRFIAQANISRQAAANGLVTGNASTHNILRLSLPDALGMWRMVEPYILLVRRADPSLKYFLCSWNGGPKSGGSLPHCHFNILGWEHRHCAFAEQVLARCPHAYWDQVLRIHQQIGLSFQHGPVAGFASLCPVKDREILMYSQDLMSGAETLHRALRILVDHGTNNFSVAAILSPDTSAEPRFDVWPRVLWRVVDRGDMRVPHSDLGAVEVLGGTTIFSSNPWEVAGWLRAGLAGD